MTTSTQTRTKRRSSAVELAIAFAGFVVTFLVLSLLGVLCSFEVELGIHGHAEEHYLTSVLLAYVVWGSLFGWRQWHRTKSQITDLESAERALQKSHDELDFLTSAAPGAFYIREPGSDGEYVYFSRRMKELFGYDPEVLRGSSIFGSDHIHPEDRVTFEAGRASLARTGKTTLEYRFKCADGSYRWVENHARALEDAAGQPECIVGYIGDVSVHKEFADALTIAVAERTAELSAVNRVLETEIAERQAIAARLQQEQDRSARLIANLPGFVFVRNYDGDRRVTFISQGVKRILGYDPSELSGNGPIDFDDLIDPDYLRVVEAARGTMLKLRKPSDCQYPIRTREGDERWVWERLRGVYSQDGRLLHVEAYVEDITERKRTDEALRTSRDYLDIVTNNLPFCVGYVDSDQRLLSFNKTFESWTNRAAEQLIGRTLDEVFSDEVYAEVGPKMAIALAGEPALGEGSGLYPDGQYRIVNRTYIPHFSATGEPEGVVFLVSDITERKQAEEELRTSRDHLDIVTNNLPFAVSYVGSDERLLSANRTFCEWFDLPPEELIGKPLSAFITPRTYAAMAPLIEEVLQGRRASAEGHGDYADGKPRIVYRDYIPHFAPDGEPEGFVMIVRDITERKKAEEQRQQYAERIEQATEVARLGYYVWDAVADECVFCSEEHARLHGLSPDDYIARAAKMDEEFALTHPEDRDYVRQQFTTLRAGEKVAFEYRILLPDGETRYVSEIVHPMMDAAGRVVQEVGTSRDITEAKLAQQALDERQRRLRVAARVAKLGHFVFDAVKNRYSFSSTEFASIHGMTPEQFSTAGAALEARCELLHPDDREGFIQALQAARDRLEPFRFEYRILGADGEVRHVREMEHNVEILDGRLLRTEGTLQDISDIKLAQQSLEDSERRLMAGARVAKLGHYVWDTVEDRCLYCSEEYARIHGMTVEEYRAFNPTLDSDSQWVHPDDQARYWQAIETTTAEKRLFSLEYRIVGADGRVRHVREIEHSMEIEDGRIVRSEGTLQDITDLKRTENSLAESEHRLRTAAQMAKLGHYVWDLVEDRCLYCSEELAALHGLSVEDYVSVKGGMTAISDRFVHPDDRERYKRELLRTEEELKPLSIDYRLLSADGQVRHVREIEHNIEVVDGRIVRSEGTIQDISDIKQAQSSLAESEQRLKTAAQMAKLGHFVWDLVEDCCLYCSEELARIHGLSVEEYIERSLGEGEDAYAYLHPEDRDRYLEALARTYDACEPVDIEYRIIRADGAVRHVHEIEHVFLVEGGVPQRSEGIIKDITEAKQAQASLTESEHRLRTAAQMAKLGHYVWDLVEDRCLYCSEELAALHGLSVDEYLECAIGAESESIEFLHPDDRERYLKALREGYDKQEPLNIEYRIVDADGEVRHVREVEHTFVVENGIPQRSEGIVQDITEIRRAEQSLAESEQRLRTAAQIAKLGHFVWDLVEDRCTYFSEEAAGILGVSVEEYVERAAGVEADAVNFVHPDDQEHYLEALQRTFDAQEPINVEYRIIRSDGEVRYLREVEHVFQTENGKPLRSEGIVQDITEIKQAEEQLRQAQKMEAIGQLTGGVAHDFNNLLTVVLGNLQLMERRVKDDERLIKRIDTAKHAAQRGAELTKGLLAFSRQQRLETEVVDLSETVGGLRRLLRTTVADHTALQFDLASDLWPAAVDPAQLESALLNLVINARDAMPKGGRLVIETANAELEANSLAGIPDVKPGLYVMLAVSDSGAGMSPEVQKRVFDPFFTTKEVGKGTGLGLSMVFGFVKQSGGHIALYSEEGHGTCFRLYFPIAENSDRQSKAQQGDTDCPTGDETILLVEDQDDLRETSRAILEDLGYHVLSAANGPSALELLQQHRSEIDLLFTDIVMPEGMNGLELADKAIANCPELKVLYTSGFSQAALGSEHADAGQKDWIAKPFLNQTLAQKIREVLDRSYNN